MEIRKKIKDIIAKILGVIAIIVVCIIVIPSLIKSLGVIAVLFPIALVVWILGNILLRLFQ